MASAGGSRAAVLPDDHLYGLETGLMKYYRCKCGKMESHSSMGPTPCSRCRHCGTNLAGHPDDHGDPAPHDFVPHDVETDEGVKTLSRCRHCMRTRAQIAAQGSDQESK